jgi:hypothetical protein
MKIQKLGMGIASLSSILAISAPAQALTTLYSQTNIVTNPGAGFSSADVSSSAPPQSTFGFGAIEGTNRLADDFTVPSEGWLIDSIRVLAYRTNTYTFPPISPFTGISLNIWDGVPGAGGTIIASSTNFLSTDWTGVYRTTSTTLTNAQRPVMNIDASFPSLSLSQGTYWADWALTSGGNSFTPPVSLGAGNARQFVTSWNALTEAGSGLSVELPFAVNGVVANPVPFEFNPATGLAVLGGIWIVRKIAKQKSKKD